MNRKTALSALAIAATGLGLTACSGPSPAHHAHKVKATAPPKATYSQLLATFSGADMDTHPGVIRTDGHPFVVVDLPGSYASFTCVSDPADLGSYENNGEVKVKGWTCGTSSINSSDAEAFASETGGQVIGS